MQTELLALPEVVKKPRRKRAPKAGPKEPKGGAAIPTEDKSVGLTIEEKRVLASPYGFAKFFLKLPVYDGERAPCAVRDCVIGGKTLYAVEDAPTWQKDVFDALDPSGARVSLRTANGSGKTSTVVAGAILWHLSLFPNSLVISTAGVDRQVRHQLWPNLQRHAAKLPGFKFQESSLTIEAPNGARYVGFTTDKPERAEGWHGKDVESLVAADVGQILSLRQTHTGPLMIIVDEAKGVPKTIFEAFDRCTYQRLLYCSSPGLSAGEFYQSQTAVHSPFRKFVVPAWWCPHADHAKNAEIIRKRGEDHPLIRSAIFAEFQSNEQSYVLTVTDVDRCLMQPPTFVESGEVRAFCDFAAGGDENVLAVRRGNRARIVKAWREKDTMRAVAEFVLLFRAEGLEPWQIYADADGLGAPMIDRFHEIGWPINRAKNGAAAECADYANHGAETWFEAAEQIKKGRIILEGVDEDTQAQMTGRKYRMNERGRLVLESKEDMRKRGVDSPDRADALFGAMRKSQSMKPVQFMGSESDRWAQAREIDAGMPNDGRDLSGILPGCQC